VSKVVVFLVQSYSDAFGWRVDSAFKTMELATARRQEIWDEDNEMVHIYELIVEGE